MPADDKELYRNGVWIWAYYNFIQDFDRHREAAERDPDREIQVGEELYGRFLSALSQYLQLGNGPGNRADRLRMNEKDTADLFAFCFQLRRGWHGILRRIVGISPSAAQLRMSIWVAIFTRRLLWSYQYLKDRMADFSTLILGDSGTGKDLVAEIIGTSQFIPYLPGEDRFAINFLNGYHPVNLSSLTPTLIESELFGHTRGAFTGATSARIGHLEECSPYGALFLDEIGDLSGEIQVKLLRVLQSREFYPSGGGKAKRFHGRILSATNRDIPALVAEGSMREDFLYRIGTNVIRVPTLSQRLSEKPEEASTLLQHVLGKVLGGIDEAVFEELERKILALVKADYPWPGNVREFEQCVRTLLIASEYDPLIPAGQPPKGLKGLLARMERSEATLAEVLEEYCTHAFEIAGSYQAAADRLEADWRTVKKHCAGD
jgi:transcriptional regulator with AAA-type ATPase domain